MSDYSILVIARRTCALIVLVSSTAFGCAYDESVNSSRKIDRRPAPAVSMPNPASQSREMTEPFSRRRAMSHVRRLAGGIGVRVRATKGERRGARYAADYFRSLGYRVRTRRFPVDGGASRNVVAWWPGAMRYGIYIGGHVDSVPTSPGANDNASGVASILEVARIVAGRRPARFVKFIAFGSEEYGRDGSHHVGSEVMVRRIGAAGRRKLAGMISVDMVADGKPLLVGSFGLGPRVLGRILYRRLDRAGFAVAYRTLCDCTDSGPFERAGIPAAYMYSGPEPDYHSSSDTVANLRPRHLERSGRALLRFVRGIGTKLIAHLRSF